MCDVFSAPHYDGISVNSLWFAFVVRGEVTFNQFERRWMLLAADSVDNCRMRCRWVVNIDDADSETGDIVCRRPPVVGSRGGSTVDRYPSLRRPRRDRRRLDHRRHRHRRWPARLRCRGTHTIGWESSIIDFQKLVKQIMMMIIIIIRQFIRRRNMSIKSLQGRRTE